MKKILIFTTIFAVAVVVGIIFWLITPKTNEKIVLRGGGFEVELKPEMITYVERDIPPEVHQRFEENLKNAEEAAEKESDFSNWLDVAVAKHSLGDLWGAAEAYLKAYELGPTSSLPLDNLSQVLIEMKDYETAEKALKQGIKNVPGNDLLYTHLVDLYKNYLKKSNQEIEAVYLEGFKNTGHPNIALALVGFYEEIGEKVKAEELRNRIQKKFEEPMGE